jgi:hypothetical protein
MRAHTHTHTHTRTHKGQDNLVSIATCYRLNGPVIESQWMCGFMHLSRLALGPIQPSIKWVPGLLPIGKEAGVWHGPPFPPCSA